ncbi:cytochrome P450 [Didymella exigua CBS 183.55]|uniref:Cytochrome P450 n=1 Tax=Didymella exigua CBS 183.55 TaxID=1150837 RepID=A0A6A5RXG2_9PLEO|nr:cytochrome P450 [Didymella exigua CBS 183.55]KAF1929947.1 cytochrome P450 [Didymella exigua CBS 183.55]
MFTFNEFTIRSLFLISTVVLASCYFLLVCTRRVFFSSLRHIPGPFAARLSNLSLAIEGVKGRRVYVRQLCGTETFSEMLIILDTKALDELHNKYGDVVRVGPNEVSIANWRHLRAIYASPKTVEKDPAFYANASFVGKNNIFQMVNPTEHAARRKLSSPPYALQSVSKLDPLIQQKADDLAHRLVTEASASTTNTADAYKLCGLFSFETICKAAFAKDFEGSGGAESSLKLLRAMDGSAPTLILDVVFPFLRPTGLGVRLPGVIGDAYRSLRYWEQQSRNMVDHFLEKSSSDEKYLLSPIATGIDGYLGRRLTHEELVEEAMGYMFAGSGTTSSTMTYLLYALSLSENEHVQQRLYNEINAVPSGDISALRQHPYLNAVIKETLRRFPTIVSTLPRVLLEPLQVDEYLLPKGTVVGMQNWIHHRNPDVFPDPDRFNPERWLHSTEAMEASLTPFGIGRRNCIGQNLAWEELYLAVSAVMRAGLKLRLGPEMAHWEMEMEDRFNIAPRGRRLMLEVTRR